MVIVFCLQGTKATRCIKFCNKGLNPEIVMKGLRKMKELRYLYVDQQGVYSNRGINKRKAKFLNAFSALCCIWKVKKNVSSYFPDALQYLCWNNYPFQYLPTTFQGNNLVTLEMTDSNIVRLWEGGERKVAMWLVNCFVLFIGLFLYQYSFYTFVCIRYLKNSNSLTSLVQS